MRVHTDKHRKNHPDLKVGDMVLLSRKGIATGRSCEKLDFQMLGPYKIIEQINPVAFKLQLPKDSRLHSVFHASLLEPYHENKIQGRKQPPPEPITLEDSGPLFIVNEVLDSRYYRNGLQYLIDWEGYPPSERTWEYARSLGATERLKQHIQEFHQRYPDKPGPAERRQVPKRGAVSGTAARSRQ